MTREEVQRVIGYLRVSTADQGRSGLGLEAQRTAIDRECAHRGWELVTVYQDVSSGKKLNGRQGLKDALSDLGARKADGLVVAKLDRLSRSTVDFGKVVDLSQKHGWALVVLDPNIDLSGPFGEMMAGVLITLAKWERRVIAERTRDALAAAKAKGPSEGKQPIGRARVIAPALEDRIVRMRRRGMSFQAIAAKLTADGVPTPTGATRTGEPTPTWKWTTVQRVVRRHRDEPIRRRARRVRLD